MGDNIRRKTTMVELISNNAPRQQAVIVSFLAPLQAQHEVVPSKTLTSCQFNLEYKVAVLVWRTLQNRVDLLAGTPECLTSLKS